VTASFVTFEFGFTLSTPIASFHGQDVVSATDKATIIAYSCKIKPCRYDDQMEALPHLAAAFGQTLRLYRERAGLSQETLANRIGSVRSYIRFLEYGRKMPTINTFHLLCAALSVDPHEFMYEYLRGQSRLNSKSE
jgi:ribosome-binding protein aMBF1 (putative translation factor)